MVGRAAERIQSNGITLYVDKEGKGRRENRKLRHKQIQRHMENKGGEKHKDILMKRRSV